MESGFGQETVSALVRNFSKNKDNVFSSKIENFISSSHPALLPRIAHIKQVIKELNSRGDFKAAPEIGLRLKQEEQRYPQLKNETTDGLKSPTNASFKDR